MFTFLNEDCWTAMKPLPDQSVDLVLTDPPYGITYNKWDKELDLERFWSEVERIAKLNAAILVFGAGLFSAQVLLSNPKHYRYKWIWEKSVATGFLNAKKAPLRCFEELNVFYRKLPTYNPQFTQGKPYKETLSTSPSTTYRVLYPHTSSSPDGKRYPRDVIKGFGNKSGKHIHPTQKPVELLEYFIKTYSNEGDLVLDPFAGSCSCGHACLNTKRDFIGFEKDGEYYRRAKESLNTI